MHPLRRRRFALPSHLVLGLLLPLLGFGLLSAEKAVAITVDGHTTQVRTSAATVGAALERAEIPVRPADEVAPDEQTPLRDGMRITVRREAGLDDARLAAARSGPRRPDAGASRLARTEAVLPYTLVADGEEREGTTTATTVGGVLHEHDVSLGDQDRVSHDLEDSLTAGIRIVVERVEVRRETVEVAVPHGTEEREDPDLPAGEREVVRDGEDGLVEQTVEVVVVDGAEESRTVVAEETLRPTTDAIVAVGAAPEPEPEPEPAPAPEPEPEATSKPATPAREPAPAPAPEPEADRAPSPASGGVWDRLAQCESGGNWSINTGNGYYGGLQFSLGAWKGVGGSGYPHEASRATQIEMGKRLQAAQGWGAWPHCSAELGLR